MGSPPPPAATVSASEVGDYAFCPRAHWYSTHPPDGAPAEAALRRADAGTRAHARALRATERRAGSGWAYWLLLLVGVALAAGGGIAWIRGS